MCKQQIEIDRPVDQAVHGLRMGRGYPADGFIIFRVETTNLGLRWVELDEVTRSLTPDSRRYKNAFLKKVHQFSIKIMQFLHY